MTPLIALALCCKPAHAQPLSFYVDPGSPWPSGWYNAAVTDMQTVVNMYNAYGDFTQGNSGNIYVYYNAGIPTEQSSYNSNIGVGGTYPNVRVLLHESSHWLGTGTYSSYWSGPHASAMIQQFDGVGAVLNGDGIHYWPYGENYDSESSPVNDARHVAMVYALRQDFGLETGDPSSWAATNVTLTSSDPVGQSGFNYMAWNGTSFSNTWSDNTFAHPNANYSTGAFDLRTPTGYPSWTFAGKSLTVNAGGRLLFNSWGTTGIITINNLTLAGGTVRHDQTPQDLFQLASNAITLASGTTSTFDAANGSITVLSPIGGAGGLATIGTNTVSLNAANTFTGPLAVNAGTLALGPGGSLALGPGGSLGGNAITVGSTTTAGTLAATGNATIGTSGSPTITLAATNGSLSTQNGAANTLTIHSATAGATVLTLTGGNTVKMDSTAAGVDSIVLGPGLKASAGLANTIALNLVDRPYANRTSTLINAPGGFTGNGNFSLSVSGANTFGMTFALDSSNPNQLNLVETIAPAPNTAYFVGSKGASWVANNGTQGNFSSDATGATLLNTLPAYNTNVVFKASSGSSTSAASSTLDSPLTVNSVTFTGTNSGGFSVSPGTNGILTLAPAASTSGLTVNSGTSTVNLSVPIVVGADQTWTTNSSNGLNISSVISGSSNLTKAGTGTLTLSGASTFTGNITVNAGTVAATNGAVVAQVRNAEPFGDATVAGRTVTINSGGTVSFAVGNVLGDGDTSTAPALSFVVNQGGVLKTASNDAGGGGGGDANIFGNITLNGGTFTTGNGYNATYPAAEFLGTITTTGTTPSTINTNATNTTANGIGMAGYGTTFNIGATGGGGTDLTISIPLLAAPGGGGTLIKTGPGSMLLTANNTYNNNTIVNGGSLTVSGANARLVSGLIVANGTGNTATATISSGAIVTSGNEVDVTNQGGTGTLNVLTGGTLNANAALNVGNGNGATNAASSTLNVNGGTIVTNGNNPFATGYYGNANNVAVTNIGYGSDGTTRGTITSASEVWIGDDGATGTMNVNNGGTLNANNWLIVGRRNSSGTLNISGNGAVNKGANNPLYIAFSYQSNGATGTVNQNGGTFTSSVPLNFAYADVDTGTYNLNGGTLSVPQIVRGAGTGTFNFNGGTLQAATGANTAFMTGLTTANVRNGGAIIDTNGQNITLGQSLVHSTIGGDATIDGGLTKNGTGTLTLATRNTFTGNVVINGGTLQLNNANAALPTPIARYNFNDVSGSTVINGGSGGATMDGTLNANGGTGSIDTTAGPGAGMGALILHGNGTTVDVNSGVTDLSGTGTWTVSAWIKTTQPGATLFNKGDGSSWNSGFSTFYLGGTNGGAGGIPNAVRWGGGWLTGATTVNDGSWHLITYTDDAGTKSVYVDGQQDKLDQNQFNNTDTGTKIRIGFAPDPGDGAATTNGSLSGINFYNSALTPQQVLTLYATTVSGIPSTAGVTIAAGATFDVNGLTQQISSLSGPAGAAVTLGAGQLIVKSTADSQFAGNISGAGSFIKQGTGSLTLSGANSYTGGTTISAGTIVGASPQALGTGPLTIHASAAAQLQPGLASAVQLPAITFDGTTNAWSGTLDIANDKLIVQDAVTHAASLAKLQNQAATHNIAISTLPANYGLAVIDNAVTNFTIFGNVAVDANSILISQELLGDANADGHVDVTDLETVLNNFGSTTQNWTSGNFDSTPTIDLTDLSAVLNNFGLSNPNASSEQAPTPTPEPASLALLFVAVPVLLSRRSNACRKIL